MIGVILAVQQIRPKDKNKRTKMVFFICKYYIVKSELGNLI
jgi:hypothetical protein